MTIQPEHNKLKKHRWCAWDSNPGHQDGGADESTELWQHPQSDCYVIRTKRSERAKFAHSILREVEKMGYKKFFARTRIG